MILKITKMMIRVARLLRIKMDGVWKKLNIDYLKSLYKLVWIQTLSEIETSRGIWSNFKFLKFKDKKFWTSIDLSELPQLLLDLTD